MKINKVLVANRGEIAIRIFRSCTEIGLRTVGIYTFEDRYSLHRYKADEAYQIGEDSEPLKPYLDIDKIIAVAKENGIDAIHPGYGFLSENADFAQACEDNDIIFIGPKVSILKALGDKIMAKKVAIENDIPIIKSNEKELTTVDIASAEAEKIGYPIMLKAASGGGGRGMRVIRTDEELRKAYPESKREAVNAFGDDTVFIEKFVENPKHIEIQLLGDNHGNLVHLFERDCSVQRRYQKVIEIAPSFGLKEETKQKLYDYALKGFAVQCRITTEDPKNDFKPDYGTITTYRSASGFGIRLDAGSVYQGVNISPFFDSMLVKVTASSRTLDGACRKMRRALAEFRVRGVKTNMAFLDNILNDSTFRKGEVTVNYIKNTPKLFEIKEPRNRATKMVNFLGDIIVNGNPDVKTIDSTKKLVNPVVPKFDKQQAYPKGTKDLLTELGPEKFSQWLKAEKKIHFTDTTMRDAHQS